MTVRNVSVGPAEGVSAVLSTADPQATVTAAAVTYGEIPGETASSGESNFVVSLDGGHPAGVTIPLTLTVSDLAGHTWEDEFHLYVTALSRVAGRVYEAAGGAGIADLEVTILGTSADAATSHGFVSVHLG